MSHLPRYETVIFDGIDAITRHRFMSETRSLAWIVAAFDEHPNATAAIIRDWAWDDDQQDYVLARTADIQRWQNQVNWKKAMR